jgi:phosphoserine phosphatase
MPVLPGYDVAGMSRPAEETGGDTFDVVRTGNGLALLLADATGHGIGPALSVTQVRAMLRLAVRIGADIAGIYRHINDQLCEDLQDHRFVTAFIGQLEANEHRILYYSPGQGQLLHYHHATDACEWLGASAPPLGILPTADVGDPEVLNLEPGDIFGLLTDGVFEAIDTSEEEFGEDRVSNTVRTSRAESCANLVGRVLAEVDAHRDGVPQQDDITIVFVRRGF